MHKFFVPRENFTQQSAKIVGDDVKHIYKVLRLNKGERVSINNCEGEEYLGEITEINKSEVQVNLIEKLKIDNESPVEIHLYQGLPKSGKMDLIVQKATELGVKTITPVIMQRVISKNELGEYKKVDRWNRIALEACKQSKRSIIPKINTPYDFKKMLSEVKHTDIVFVPYENEENFGIKKALSEVTKEKIKKVAIIIGPEGGFETDEIEELKSQGANIVTLGPRILRTETAGFVCASIIAYELGDLGGII